jgi:hypothetical protein
MQQKGITSVQERPRIPSIWNLITWGMATMLVVVTITQAAPSPDELSKIRAMWESHRQYREVLQLLIAYRERPYGRTAEVDYMIATSACRVPGLQDAASKHFRWILDNYNLTASQRAVVETERQSCASGGAPSAAPIGTLLAHAGVGGKEFSWFGSELTPVTTDPVTVVRAIESAELSSRLFLISDQKSAASRIRELAGPGFRVEARGRFVLASASGHAPADLDALAQILEKTLRFFTSQYSISLPSHLITIYMVPSADALRSLAERIHGLRISYGCIGYFFEEDLSVVGVIPQKAYGTLFHELFHLVVRSNFGDIPPWLDEGMAALYEVSQFTDDRLIGQDNWRGPILERFWNSRPTVENLVKMDGRHFNILDSEGARLQRAINYATARYVALYLQNNGRLTKLYDALRNRKPLDVQRDPGTDAVGILESAFQKPVAEIDDDFGRWFCAFHKCTQQQAPTQPTPVQPPPCLNSPNAPYAPPAVQSLPRSCP